MAGDADLGHFHVVSTNRATEVATCRLVAQHLGWVAVVKFGYTYHRVVRSYGYLVDTLHIGFAQTSAISRIFKGEEITSEPFCVGNKA
jgi:hypothetical protein